MTDDRMALPELVEKAADADLVRDMLAFAAERIIDAEAETLTGAAKGARSALRETHPQRLPRGALGHPRRPDRAADHRAAKGLMPPELS